MEFGVGALALVAGFPVILLIGILGLQRLEAWMIQPDERADAVTRLLNAAHGNDIEAEAVRIFAAAEPPKRPVRPPKRGSRTAKRRARPVRPRSRTASA